MDRESLIGLTKNLYRLTLLFPKKEPLRYKMRELADDILADLTFFSKENLRSIFSTTIENIGCNLEVLDSFFEVAKSQNWVSPAELLKIQQEYSKINEEIKKILSQAAAKKDYCSAPSPSNFSEGDAIVYSQPDLPKKIIRVEPLQIEKTEIAQTIEEMPEDYGDLTPQSALFQGLAGKDKRSVIEIKSAAETVVSPTPKKDFNGINERQKKILEILKEKEKIQVWELKKIFPEVTKRTLRRDFEQLLKQGLINRVGEKNNTFYQLKTNLV